MVAPWAGLESLENRVLLSVSPLPFERIEPLGSLIFVSRANTAALSAGQTVDFDCFFEGGQTISAVARPDYRDDDLGNQLDNDGW